MKRGAAERRPARRASVTGVLTGTAMAVLASACGAPTTEHVALTTGVHALQEDFVADSGKVRAIFLASPT